MSGCRTIRKFLIATNRKFNDEYLPPLERLLDVPHIVETCFADAGFGVDDVSSADDGKRYLPCVRRFCNVRGELCR